MHDKKQAKFLWLTHWVLPLIIFLMGWSVAGFLFARAVNLSETTSPRPLLIVEGDELLLGDVPIYSPHAVMVWFFRYRNNQIPGSKEAYQQASIAIYISILIFVVLRIIVSLAKRNKLQNTGGFGTARWANPKELIEYGYRSKKGGIVLGQSDAQYGRSSRKGLFLKKPGKPLITKGDKHILIAAPTRSGKGINNVIPTLTYCPDSMIVLDIKSELWHRTRPHREQFSKCYRIDPTREDTTCYNPLDTIPREPDEAIPAAQQLAEILVPDEQGSNSKHWVDSGRNFLSGIIVYVVMNPMLEEKNLLTVKSIVDDPNTPLEKTLKKMMESNIPYVRQCAQNISSKPENERGSVISTAMKGFTLYADPKIARLTSHSDILPDDLRTEERPVTLYLCCPPSDLQRILPLYNMIITSIVRTQIRKIERPDYRHRLVLLLDEFPLLGKNAFLEQGLAYFAGYNIIMVLIIQSINQLKQAYGQNTSIMDNTHIKVVFASGDPETQRTISKLLGQATIIREGKSTSGKRMAGILASMSINQNEAGRSLLTEDEIGTLDETQCLILTIGKRPYKADIIRYFEDPLITRMKIVTAFPLSYTESSNTPPNADIQTLPPRPVIKLAPPPTKPQKVPVPKKAPVAADPSVMDPIPEKKNSTTTPPVEESDAGNNDWMYLI